MFETVKLNETVGTVTVESDRNPIKSNKILRKQQQPVVTDDPTTYAGTSLQSRVTKLISNYRQSQTPVSRLISLPELTFATIGKGSLYGQEDVALGRLNTYTVRTKTRTTLVYWISKSQFM